MDFISSSILSGALYDLIKDKTNQACKQFKEIIKQRLQAWVIDDNLMDELIEKTKELAKLEFNSIDDLKNHFDEDRTWNKLMKKIKYNQDKENYNKGIQAENIHAENIISEGVNTQNGSTFIGGIHHHGEPYTKKI